MSMITCDFNDLGSFDQPQDASLHIWCLYHKINIWLDTLSYAAPLYVSTSAIFGVYITKSTSGWICWAMPPHYMSTHQPYLMFITQNQHLVGYVELCRPTICQHISHIWCLYHKINNWFYTLGYVASLCVKTSAIFGVCITKSTICLIHWASPLCMNTFAIFDVYITQSTIDRFNYLWRHHAAETLVRSLSITELRGDFRV